MYCPVWLIIIILPSIFCAFSSSIFIFWNGEKRSVLDPNVSILIDYLGTKKCSLFSLPFPVILPTDFLSEHPGVFFCFPGTFCPSLKVHLHSSWHTQHTAVSLWVKVTPLLNWSKGTWRLKEVRRETSGSWAGTCVLCGLSHLWFHVTAGVDFCLKIPF